MSIGTAEKLDIAVQGVLQALRELECDNDETTNCMEDNMRYIIFQMLCRVYSSSKTDEYIALGVVESAKDAWSNFVRNMPTTPHKKT